MTRAMLSGLLPLLLAGLLLPLPLDAQQIAPPPGSGTGTGTAQPTAPPAAKPLEGYLRFVNATGRKAPLKIKLDGRDINPEGFPSGHATGAVGLPIQPMQVEMEQPELGSHRLSVTLKPGEVTTVVALPQAADKDPKKPDDKPKVELASMVHTSPSRGLGSGSRLTVVQATSAPELTFLVDGKPLVCEKLKPVTAEGVMSDFVTLELAQTKMATLNFTDPGDRVIVFFTDAGGKVMNTSFNNTVE